MPKANRSGEGVCHRASILPAVSNAIGRVKITNVRGRGSLEGTGPSQGKRQVPHRKPRYIPRQRAHTAMGNPKICRQRVSI
jgi:hypothetical protein